MSRALPIAPFIVLGAAAAVTAAAASRVVAQSDVPSQYSYTPAQAARGQQVYAAHCAACHGKNMQGNEDDAPALVGERFDSHWRKRLPALFEKISRAMPADDPGTLTGPQAIDVTAAILQANRIKTSAVMNGRTPRT
jgi:mono/diheme cytochrome c family protein